MAYKYPRSTWLAGDGRSGPTMQLSIRIFFWTFRGPSRKTGDGGAYKLEMSGQEGSPCVVLGFFFFFAL